MHNKDRMANYFAQNHGFTITPRQARRLKHKWGQGKGKISVQDEMRVILRMKGQGLL